MDSPENSKPKNSKPSARKPKTKISAENELQYIKNDLRDIKIDIREFRADIYNELHEASSVYTLLKNGNARTFSSVKMLRDLIEENIEYNNKKLEEINKHIQKINLFYLFICQ
ncbi:hypothetical protein HUT03_00775 [Candidatus Liberibacter africanus]|uniref:hypothetical protein n=1 Tax=Liberibacter africanus TaxID=34020 RepID=UPI001AE7A45F|nr:hypothetical protein [Candidatus Liberibacter africanus]QTP63664.1 hypothetical protein HUT03_00775 [Candidatus Liberibacter africanus]